MRRNVSSRCISVHRACQSLCGMPISSHFRKLRLMKRWDGKSPVNVMGTHCLEKIVVVFLAVAALNLVLVLLTGGYALALGRLRFSAHDFQSPLLLFLSAAMVAVWLRERERNIPASMRLRSPLLLFLAIVFIYNLNGRAIGAGDTIPASYLPLSILRTFNFDLDEFPFLYESGLPWFLQRIKGHIVSTYPPWAGVLALPVYLLPVVGGLSPQSPLIHDLEKLSASLITALSVVLLFFALRRLTNEKNAWFIAIVYAFGTSSFSTSSQALWQHGPSQLFLALTIYWLVRGLEEPRWSAYAGFALAVAIICRPVNGLIALPIGAYMLQKRRDQLMGFLLAAFPPLLLFMAYNIHYFGSLFTTGFIARAVSPSSFWKESSHLLSTPLHEGLVAVLISPSRGLFIYSPILLVSFVGMIMVWKTPKQTLLKCLSLAPLPIILLTAKWINWWGGGSYGPRLLADITPILCLFLYPAFEWMRSRLFFKYIIACLLVLSIGLHGLRVFGGGDWNGHPNIDYHPERLWSWVDSPPMYYGKNIVMDAYAKLKRRAVGFPTSLDAPEKLRASYYLMSLAPDSGLHPKNFLICRINVVNTGAAVWLSRAKGEKGEVRLVWRWFAGDREVPSTLGGWILGYDILPGQAYEFRVEIATPKEPGEYTLKLGLVSMQVTSFADQGVAPLKIPMQVLRAPQGD
jgi:Dolichyl-phosphate-mannose-protein mannosyltransferase